LSIFHFLLVNISEHRALESASTSDPVEDVSASSSTVVQVRLYINTSCVASPYVSTVLALHLPIAATLTRVARIVAVPKGSISLVQLLTSVSPNAFFVYIVVLYNVH